jgi:hypothetical protein
VAELLDLGLDLVITEVIDGIAGWVSADVIEVVDC